MKWPGALQGGPTIYPCSNRPSRTVCPQSPSGSTIPGCRLLSAQGAILTRRIQDGIAASCWWLTTETEEDKPENPNPSYRNMLRSGFKLAYPQPIYQYKP